MLCLNGESALKRPQMAFLKKGDGIAHPLEQTEIKKKRVNEPFDGLFYSACFLVY
jgi:hypothetical protein